MAHANTPPQIPEVTDEAGASPAWLPILGAALLVAFAAWIVVGHVVDANGAEVGVEADAQ